jgi:hypothetical protein
MIETYYIPLVRKLLQTLARYLVDFDMAPRAEAGNTSEMYAKTRSQFFGGSSFVYWLATMCYLDIATPTITGLKR